MARSWPGAWVTALLLSAGCATDEPEPAAGPTPGLPPEPYPATAKPDIPRALLDGLAAERHPGDGGGRAWIDWPGGEPVPHLAGIACGLAGIG